MSIADLGNITHDVLLCFRDGDASGHDLSFYTEDPGAIAVASCVLSIEEGIEFGFGVCVNLEEANKVRLLICGEVFVMGTGDG